MKRVIKKEKIFRFCSVIFLSSLFVFFSFRLVYNYMKEQKANSLIDNGMLSTKIINNLKKEKMAKGHFACEKTGGGKAVL